MRLHLLAVAFALASLPAAENPLTEAVKRAYNGAKLNLVETAEVMPQEHYEFRLTPPQRSFGEWIQHTALGNYNFCSQIRGETNTDRSQLRGLTQKSELVEALKQSFAFCDEALGRMDDRKAVTEVTVGGHKTVPVNAMVALVGSLNEHYGNLVGYLRTKGITPPSSARAKKR